MSCFMFMQAFHDIAYRADSREDLLSAINGFLDDTVVLPPGEWDRNVLLPILVEQSRAMARRRKMAKAGKDDQCKRVVLSFVWLVNVKM